MGFPCALRQPCKRLQSCSGCSSCLRLDGHFALEFSSSDAAHHSRAILPWLAAALVVVLPFVSENEERFVVIGIPLVRLVHALFAGRCCVGVSFLRLLLRVLGNQSSADPASTINAVDGRSAGPEAQEEYL